MEDTEIIKLYLDRDEAAIAQTDRKYGGSCRSLSFGILRNRQDSEECVNDSYMALWNTIPPQKPQRFPAYLCRVVHNISVQRLRQLSALKRGGGERELILEELSSCAAGGDTPEEICSARELALTLRSFADSLPEEQRLIFTARYYLCLPVKEISEKTGFGKSKVCTSLSRSREKLRKRLQEEGYI